MRFPMPSLKRVALIIEDFRDLWPPHFEWRGPVSSGAWPVVEVFWSSTSWDAAARWPEESQWDGILCRPTDPALARTFRRMGCRWSISTISTMIEAAMGGFGPCGDRRDGEHGICWAWLSPFAFCGYEGSFGRGAAAGRFWRRWPGPVSSAVYESEVEGRNAPRWDEMWKVGPGWALPKPVRGLWRATTCAGSTCSTAANGVGLMVPENVRWWGRFRGNTVRFIAIRRFQKLASPGAERIGYAAAGCSMR